MFQAGRCRWGLIFGILLISTACIDQFNPTHDWKRFRQEEKISNRPPDMLTEDGKLPEPKAAAVADANQNPIDKKYKQLCATCHGDNGDGKGPAAAGLNPKPRSFSNWDYNDIPAQYKSDVDGYIAKVIKEGGPSVGKSASMAAWGGMLSSPDELTGLVLKVKSFKK